MRRYTDDGEQLLTAREVAARLGITRATWNAYVARGECGATPPDDRDGPYVYWRESTVRQVEQHRGATATR